MKEYKHPEDNEQYKGLKIQKALDTPPSVRNPYFTKLKRRPQYSVDDYVKGILEGNVAGGYSYREFDRESLCYGSAGYREVLTIFG